MRRDEAGGYPQFHRVPCKMGVRAPAKSLSNKYFSHNPLFLKDLAGLIAKSLIPKDRRRGVSTIRSAACLVLGLREPLLEPAQHAQRVVARVGGLVEDVAFIRIDHHLRGNFHRRQSVVPLERLLHGHFAVAVTGEDQGWWGALLHEKNRTRLLIDGGIVIDRRAEKRNHPLADIVQAVIALKVGEARARNGGSEVRLGLGPHRHVAAVTVSADPDS